MSTENIDYDIIKLDSNLCSPKDLKNLKNDVFNTQHKPKEQIEEEKLTDNIPSKDEKKRFYNNLLASPYPRQDGSFADCNVFQDRIKLMEPIEEGKVYKTIIRQGNGKEVSKGDAVLFNMNSFTFDYYDEPFDSTFARKKAILCRLHHILVGYGISLLSMRTGEMSEFAIHRSVAYGELGCPPRIPANTDIIVIFELLDVYPKGTIQYYHSLSHEEQQEELTSDNVISFAHQDRKEGNENYFAGQYQKAIINYKRAIDLLEKNFMDNTTAEPCKKLLLSLYQNIANTYLKLNVSSSIVYFARRALRIDSNSAKANYLMGMGLLMFGKNEASMRYLKAAYRSKPNNEDINKALDLLNHRLTVDRMQTKNMYKKMAGAVLPQ